MSPSLSDMMVVAVEARQWWHCNCNGSGGAVMAVAVAARDGAMMIIFSGAKFTKFCLLCLLVVCSSWLYHSTYNTLEDMIEFWRQMVRNLMTHFSSQHSWLAYKGTGTSINVQHFHWWTGSKNWLKIFVGNYFLSGFSFRQIHLDKNSLVCLLPASLCSKINIWLDQTYDLRITLLGFVSRH